MKRLLSRIFLSFKVKTLALTLPILIIVSAVYTYESITTEQAMMKQELLSRATEITSLTAKNSELAILSENTVFLRKTAASINELHAVKEATLYDKDWRSLIYTGDKAIAAAVSLSVKQPVSYKDAKDAMYFFAPVFTVTNPDSDPGGFNDTLTHQMPFTKHIGWVAIAFSKQPIVAAQRQNLLKRITLGMVFAAISSILIFIFISIVTKPLKKVFEAVKRFQDGQYEEIVAGSEDEIGVLASEFNRMSRVIREREQAIINKARLSEMSANISNTITHSTHIGHMLRQCIEIPRIYIDNVVVSILIMDTDEQQGIGEFYTDASGYNTNILMEKIDIKALSENSTAALYSDMNDCTFINRQWASGQDIKSLAVFPLSLDMKHLGVFSILFHFSISDEVYKTLFSVANALSLGIEYKLNEKRLRQKTSQLEEFNINLEGRVQEEIQKSRRQEQLLIQQSKFVSMGEMVVAIAHQWRQPLNAIGVLVQEVRDAQKYGELTGAYFDGVIKNVMEQLEFMSKTIDNFRNFFKPSKEKVIFNISDTVFEAYSLISAQLQHNRIHIEMDIADNESLNTTGYRNEFIQVLINIMINARDAVAEARDAGKLNNDAGTISILCRRQENTIVIAIEDDATGIGDGLEGKIFEPFFTTKGFIKGTGIGLYMSKMIIENNMGGRLYAENTEKGARFVIELESVN
ncbi:MAG: ATP-binding protein [Nitrospirae bacterium YQR-1]